MEGQPATVCAACACSGVSWCAAAAMRVRREKTSVQGHAKQCMGNNRNLVTVCVPVCVCVCNVQNEITKNAKRGVKHSVGGMLACGVLCVLNRWWHACAT